MTAETANDLPPWDGKLASYDEMFLGNAAAAKFMLSISKWSHFYDDLIDADKPVAPETVHEVMWELTVGLGLNEFYQKNVTLLAPVIAAGILSWRAANDMEKVGDKEELYIAHSARYGINDLAYIVMCIVGGPAHAARYARDARLSFQRDTLAHYLKEHGHV